MAILIAGDRSGAGKTTVTLMLLAFLCRMHQSPSNSSTKGGVQSFKVGPDYIDPMFHRYVTGRPCRNLDPILTSEAYVRACFAEHQATCELSLIEGVMGLFDGATGDADTGSTAHVARVLNVPIVLVMDCSRLSRSVAAIAHGYTTFDPHLQIVGWVLNRVGSDRHEQMLRAALEPLNRPILGVIRREEAIALPDRHLGLVPTDELPELDRVVDQLADLGQICFQWDQLLPLLRSNGVESVLPERSPPSSLSQENSVSRSKTLDRSPLSPLKKGGTRKAGARMTRPSPSPKSPSSSPSPSSSLSPPSPFRIAIARDRAFSFYYADNLDRLQALGAELVAWSPLNDEPLPDDTCGLYLGGGFPEVFAAELAHNQVAQQSVRQAIQAGLPTYAECGGLMYLCRTLVDFEGHEWPMVGLLPTTVRMEKRLTLGYRRAIALQDSPLVTSGTVVWGHEFHRSALDGEPETPLYQTEGYTRDRPVYTEGWALFNLHASYVHLHWGAVPELPLRFIRHCQIWQSNLELGNFENRK